MTSLLYLLHSFRRSTYFPLYFLVLSLMNFLLLVRVMNPVDFQFGNTCQVSQNRGAILSLRNGVSSSAVYTRLLTLLYPGAYFLNLFLSTPSPTLLACGNCEEPPRQQMECQTTSFKGKEIRMIAFNIAKQNLIELLPSRDLLLISYVGWCCLVLLQQEWRRLLRFQLLFFLCEFCDDKYSILCCKDVAIFFCFWANFLFSL